MAAYKERALALLDELCLLHEDEAPCARLRQNRGRLVARRGGVSREDGRAPTATQRPASCSPRPCSTPSPAAGPEAPDPQQAASDHYALFADIDT